MPSEAVIVAARRTPIGTRGRGLATLTVDQLAAPVLRANLEDGMAALGKVALGDGTLGNAVLGDGTLGDGSLGDVVLGDVVLGNCMGPGGNSARVS
ncbi:MAG TPA: hypothetical protein VIG76_09555, partial [Amnibacterium sp.]